MLRITIPAGEAFNEQTSEFISIKEQVLSLEHSLVSISKWESKWCKPFLGKEPKTRVEMIDYIRCMTLTQNVDPNVYDFINSDNIEQISKYIEAPMTATWFNEKETKGKHNNEVITSEIIYYWMVSFNIPVEFQKWHLNRLLTLIKVCSLKNEPQKKMSKREILDRNKAINKARRESMHTSG